MNLLDFKSYTKETLLHILNLADDMKRSPKAYTDSLQGKKLYMLFEKTSTRTYLSFAAGITELGGSYYSQNWCDSNFAIGDTVSEIRYVGQNVDAILVRLKKNELLQTMASHTLVPLINGCDDTFHPCQALADVMTIRELFGNHNAKLCYIGAKNNILNSLLEIMGLLGGAVYGFTPIYNEGNITDAFYQSYQESGTYKEIPIDTKPEALTHIIAEMDIVYTDTWLDMEYFNHPEYADKKEEIISKMMPFQINSQLLKDSKSLVMHDMPIHIGYEISREVADKHMDTILRQAENRRHVEKAALYYLLKYE